MRFLLYAHDGVTSADLRRSMALAARLRETSPNASVMLVAGTDLGHVGVPPGVEVVHLPGLAERAGAGGRFLSVSAADLLDLRSRVLETLVRSYRPDVMVVDTHPLGTAGELRPALEAQRLTGRRAVLGVGDILDEAHASMRAASAAAHDAITRFYDRVLVYGQRGLFDPVMAYGWPADIAERVRYCGHVVSDFTAEAWREDAPPAFVARRRSRPLVLAAVGSGEDALPLLAAFVRAVDAPWDAAILTAPAAADPDHLRLRTDATAAGVECVASVPGLARWFGAVDALVTTTGPDLVIDALATGLPIVCVPRTRVRTEERIRARALARAELLRLADASPGALRRSVALALETSRPSLAQRARRTLDLDGAAGAAAYLVELAAAGDRDRNLTAATPAAGAV